MRTYARVHAHAHNNDDDDDDDNNNNKNAEQNKNKTVLSNNLWTSCIPHSSNHALIARVSVSWKIHLIILTSDYMQAAYQ